jgi:hypothetical protein
VIGKEFPASVKSSVTRGCRRELPGLNRCLEDAVTLFRSFIVTAFASASLAACVAPPGEPAEAATVTDTEADTAEIQHGLSSHVAAVIAAQATYTTTVADNVRANAATVGISIPSSAVRSAKVPRDRTVAVAPASATELVFLTKAFVGKGKTYQPGLYQIATGSQGATLYHFTPGGRLDLGFGIHPPGTTPLFTPLGGDLCGGGANGIPTIILDFCLDFVACAAYDNC